MHTFSSDALLLEQYGLNKLFRGSTQLQRYPSGIRSGGAAAEGRQMEFTNKWCCGRYGYTGTTSCSMGGRRPLTGSPMRWRVLWQPGPLDQGAEVLWQPDVLANFFHRSVTDSLGDCPFHSFKKKQNLEVKKKMQHARAIPFEDDHRTTSIA